MQLLPSFIKEDGIRGQDSQETLYEVNQLIFTQANAQTPDSEKKLSGFFKNLQITCTKTTENHCGKQ